MINLSKQLVDNMFGESCDSSTTTCSSGTRIDIEVVYKFIG